MREARSIAAVEADIAPLDEVYRLVGVPELKANEKRFLFAGPEPPRAVILARWLGTRNALEVGGIWIDDQGGLGIGLTLVKRLVEMHAGSVEARSAGVGRGSEFVVHLPILGERAEVAGPVPASVRPPSPRRRILVVDDNEDSAVSFAMFLELAGNQVYMAHDGPEAFEAIEKLHPEVVLLDIGLPGLSGYEVCRRVREQPWGKSIVLIALTGWGQDEDRRLSREAGFDGHLVKPVDPEELQRLLADVSNGEPATS
jgi:CheY-like chemotaxis protein